ncbi:hypothetical protein M011DRAFT_38266 [Sporormia fimetaria CBS 119925]|uniref:Uncharacterized protein n=1 Tax=Sporormia fimetaria CBS 119925 TaxID=1340428 RepID=A0A6A6VF00_9PLEO|nr:hypothetical protein M011DRAFT_38266 [Sporormia fimetaria CBS 119925]
MHWLLGGVRSAIFYYASCAPCSDGLRHRKRRRQARKDSKSRQDSSESTYRHPQPFETNPHWQEEIVLGPGPPKRTSKRSTTTNSSVKSIISGVRSKITSKGNSFNLRDQGAAEQRLKDEYWNVKRFQREDEYLWGMKPPIDPEDTLIARGSSVGIGGAIRPGSSQSYGDSYRFFTSRVPDMSPHAPPLTRPPSTNPDDYRWMLQPPPKATVMAGKERPSSTSCSGSGESSRVDLHALRRAHLQRWQAAGHSELASVPDTSPDRPTSSRYAKPHALPEHPSSTRRRQPKRQDTPVSSPDSDASSEASTSTIIHSKKSPRVSTPSLTRTSPVLPTPPPPVHHPDNYTLRLPNPDPNPSITITTPRLTSVARTDSPTPILDMRPRTRNRTQLSSSSENAPMRSMRSHIRTSTHSSESIPYLMMKQRSSTIIRPPPTLTRSDSLTQDTATTSPTDYLTSPSTTITTSTKPSASHSSPPFDPETTPMTLSIPKQRQAKYGDISDDSSLGVLQELVHPGQLLGSRFVSAPLIEARIRLPDVDLEEEGYLSGDQRREGRMSVGF